MARFSPYYTHLVMNLTIVISKFGLIINKYNKVLIFVSNLEKQ